MSEGVSLPVRVDETIAGSKRVTKDHSSIRRRHFMICILLAWMTAAVPAAAQPAPAAAPAAVAGAQTLFDEAMKLVEQHKYAEAVDKLKKSQELAPAMGTQFWLAHCYEKVGLTGSAYPLFLEVADKAKAAGRNDREAEARKRAEDLKPMVPMVHVTAPREVAGLEGLSVEVDGRSWAKWDEPFAIDPGMHTIRVSAPGKKQWERPIQALGGATVEVKVPVLEAEKPAVAQTASAATGTAAVPVTQRPSGSSLDAYRIGAIVAGAVGVVGLGVGAGFGAMAASRWNEALSYCENRDLPANCNAQFFPSKADALTSATLSTAAFIGAGVGLAAGTLLLVLAPRRGDPAKDKTNVTVTPVVGQRGMMTVLEGRF